MAIPIIGFVGTIFVWIFGNFYLGSVEIQTPGQYNEISISVFDKKGQESTLHTPQFQLMPGKYHLTVTVDKNSPQQLDTEVALGKTSLIKVTGNPISTTSPPPDDASAAAPHTVHKHWWQFWKKDNANLDSHNDPANDSVE